MARKPEKIIEPIKDGSMEQIVDSIFEKTLELKEIVEQQQKKKKNQRDSESSDDNED